MSEQFYVFTYKAAPILIFAVIGFGFGLLLRSRGKKK